MNSILRAVHNNEYSRVIDMCRASELSKAFVNLCLDSGYEINTSKLQKLLFIAQGEYISKYEKPLFSESILAWKCGVAIKEVNSEYSNFLFGFDKPLEEHLVLLDNEKSTIQNVVKKYGGLSSSQLNQDYRAKTLWERHYRAGEATIIPIDEIRRVFLENENR